MRRKQLYRSLGFVGTVSATCGSVFLANVLIGQPVATSRLHREGLSTATGSDVAITLLTVAVTTVAMQPLYKPRSRRILDTMTQTVRSLLLGFLVLATLGHYGFPHRLPPTELLVTVASLVVVLPIWFVWLQRRYLDGSGRTLVVGHDPERVATAIDATAGSIAGYASSTRVGDYAHGKRVGTDGGRKAAGTEITEYEHLGGLSRLDEILANSNIGTVVLALPRTDRGEFFGVLNTCHRYGVEVEVPDEHGDSVLLSDDAKTDQEGYASIDLEPWDFQDRLCKRLFDVCFAGAVLLCTAPLLGLVALAIKLDSEGPVFYKQKRTALYGDTFDVYKFRTMLPESEVATPGEETDRVTRVGRFLRQTHIDEIPQLWSILRGRMSVVGPRAVWTEEESLLLEETRTWQKRWFVKPGLTGLAQINDASSETPQEKLACDLTYIRKQSLRFDAKIVVRQLWLVATDAASMIASRVRSSDGPR